MLSTWSPWSLFDELEGSMLSSSREWPQFDIEDTDDETILTADLPGMSDEDIEITVQAPYLIVRGERRAKTNGRFVKRARFHGAFERRFLLGDGYDLDRVHADIVNGELCIRLEKAAKAKPRRIKLGSGVAAKVKGLLTGEKKHAA